MNAAENRPAAWDDADAIAVVLFGLFTVSGGILARLSGVDLDRPIALGAAHVLAMLLPAAFVVALITKKLVQNRTTLRSLFGIQDPVREIMQGLIFGLLAVPAALAIAFLTGLAITHVTGEPPVPQAVMRSIMLEETPLPIAAAVLILSITFVPFAEEVLYRGILVSVLKRLRGTLFAVIISSLFFGLLHLSPVNTLSLCLLGAALATVYLRTKSLLTSIAMHAAFNAINLMLLTLPQSVGKGH